MALLRGNSRIFARFEARRARVSTAIGDWHHIFSTIIKNEPKKLMDLFIIILSFVLAYGIFVLIAVKLAKVFFPKISDEDLKAPSARQRHPKRVSV